MEKDDKNAISNSWEDLPSLVGDLEAQGISKPGCSTESAT